MPFPSMPWQEPWPAIEEQRRCSRCCRATRPERRSRRAISRSSSWPSAARPDCRSPASTSDADFVFPDERLIVETDSWRHHKSRDSFERDRRRDAIHAAAGWRTLRFTWRQIEQEPRSVAAAVEAALYRGASAASSVA